MIKGYHAEEREAGSVRRRSRAAAANVMKSLTLTSVLGSASTTVLGLVSALVMWLGGHNVLSHSWTVGDYFSYNMFLAIMVMPVFQIVNIGTQLTEAFAGLDRTREIMAELEENQDPKRTLKMPPIHGTVASIRSSFLTSPTSPCCTALASQAEPGHGYGFCGFIGIGQIDRSSACFAPFIIHRRARCWWMALILRASI